MNTDKKNRLTQIVIISLNSFLLVIFLCGCEAFKKKFVRKPKQERSFDIVVQNQEYESPYSIPELYTKSYTYWKAAHQELLHLLSGPVVNRKRQLFYAERSIAYLRQMQDLLVPEKKKELDAVILKYKEISRQLDTARLGHREKLNIKSSLKEQRRLIQRKFTYQCIQEYLIKN